MCANDKNVRQVAIKNSVYDRLWQGEKMHEPVNQFWTALEAIVAAATVS
jgi:hypothetical protein